METRSDILALGLLLALTLALPAHAATDCHGLGKLNLRPTVQAAPYPRKIDPQKTFENLVDWVHSEIIVKQGAPGLVVGISGTDSVLAFLAVAKAYEKAGSPNRAVGIHYRDEEPSWFELKVVPWLKAQAPGAQVIVETGIANTRDGVRWGMLLDWSVLQSFETGVMRPPNERFWVVGTRNATEQALLNFSNASTAASLQVLTHLWKSEVLEVCKALGIPEEAVARSCQADCACGREELSALYHSETDAIVMVRKGILAPEYLANIPSGIRKELENYVDTQMARAGFKNRIPYHVDPAVVQLDRRLDLDLLAKAKQELASGSDDVKTVSRVVPIIIGQGYASIASDLVTGFSANRRAWLPEALALLNTPGLIPTQRQQMVRSVFNDTKMGSRDARKLARISAFFGYQGFRFPQWRFFAQHSGDEPSLFETYGMTRLTRSTDVKDPTLPVSNPGRDLWGPGFRWQEESFTVEYRRAYLLLSNQTPDATVTVLIRNNSYYFGRDRLPESVLVSLDKLSTEELQNLTPETLAARGFIPLQNFTGQFLSWTMDEKIDRLEKVVAYFAQFDRSVDEWVWGKARTALVDLLWARLNSGEPPLHLGVVSGQSPSWNPQASRPLTRENLRSIGEEAGPALRNHDPDERLVLMSGREGDLPN